MFLAVPALLSVLLVRGVLALREGPVIQADRPILSRLSVPEVLPCQANREDPGLRSSQVVLADPVGLGIRRFLEVLVVRVGLKQSDFLGP